MDLAVSARMTVVAQASTQADTRGQPAAQRRQALRRQVQRMWIELDPRQPEQLGRQPATGGDHIGDHEIRAQLLQSRHVELRHPPGALMDLGPGIGVVVDIGRIEADEFDSLDAGGPRGIEPLHPGQQRRDIARGQELQAQRQGREGMSGIRSGDHSYAHRPTLPQRRTIRLRAWLTNPRPLL